MTETFLTKEWTPINTHYAINILAEQGPKGRPKGGVTCLIKEIFSPFSVPYKSKNALVVRTALCVIICVYFQPDFATANIIDEISQCLDTTTKDDPVILAGDLNCRVDIISQKTTDVVNYLEEEGLALVNDKATKTYVCHNGASTIDLVFVNSKVKPLIQDIIPEVERKHLPVVTTLQLENAARKRLDYPVKLSRKADISALDNVHTNTITTFIKENTINEAASLIEELILRTTHTVDNTKRKSKPWFSKECYEARRKAINAIHKARRTQSTEDLDLYNKLRREYKTKIKEAQRSFWEEEEKRLIEIAKQRPYKALQQKQPKFPRNIPMEVWEEHLSSILQARDTRPVCPTATQVLTQELELFTEDEVTHIVMNTKNNKACGPDGIYNEHLKTTLPVLVTPLTVLLNKCLIHGAVPDKWKKSTVIMLYKGKGNTTDPNAYRGIALENTLLKVLTTLMCKRLNTIIEEKLPDSQFGFRRGRSTTQAVQCLQSDIETATENRGGKLHAIFVDYTKAFDTINRTIVMKKLENALGPGHYLLPVTRDLLTNNWMEINDGIDKSNLIQQTVGVLQGDPLSPLLFILATADIVKVIPDNVNLLMYADDMALTSTSETGLQKAFDQLVDWANENELILNAEKTVSMTFRRGGRRGTFYMGETPLKSVISFTYLGVTLQTQGNIFTRHINDRVNAATRAISDIKSIGKLSLETALQLFELKVDPVATYGLENIWVHLKKQSLEKLEKLKATYLKRVLCLSKYTPSRLVYVLAREPFYIEELRLKFLLPATPAYQDLLRELQEKKCKIWDDFFVTDAVTSREWTKGGYELRHTVTRLSVHGFHHKLCNIQRFHEPGPDCVCVRCGDQCERYHVLNCKRRSESLVKLCSD